MGRDREEVTMPYFLVGCPISAALPAARRRQGALAVADPAPSASATWPVVLAVSSSAASRRLRCAASRGGGARERDAPGLNKRKFFEQRTEQRAPASACGRIFGTGLWEPPGGQVFKNSFD